MPILIVDDDEVILQLVSIHLEKAGYTVEKASNAEAALAFLQKQSFDLTIIDVMMPGMDGFQLANIVTNQYEIPVIMLTAKGQMEDKEKGFEQGIDDYIVKPFETKELLFRVRAILRRYQKAYQAQSVVGNVKMDKDTWDLRIGEKQYIWPMKELEILLYFLQRLGRNVNRWDLIDEIWGETLDQPEFTLNTHINRVRERLKKAEATIEIVTIRGLGYRLEVKG
ncbi:response regulator transcription factor [Sutcliffiella rhizosphaerae]|uniref:Heme response regulator HssR n=1 Tax=Sutcliffiella rhizosphaerae TaxID=2880967 RepID=A0ABM8YSC5_9BACI|nr:response regulator transcription factor [Sutcliffiella rhizosphaerae]CAG9622720.1 Heme response regulator HssR [Sutcliffiella rhizosphaerae]